VFFSGTAATNCTAERSFSALRKIQTYLQYRMLENQLNALAMLNAEGEPTIAIDSEDVIDFPVAQQARRNCREVTA
jgi:hypothetical protein